MSKTIALLRYDLKNIKNDYLLILLILYPLVAAAVARFAVPPLREHFLGPGFDLADYYHVIMVFLVIMTPYVLGMMRAFTILDERDDRVLNAIMVTPLPLLSYFIYKISFTVIFSIIAVCVVVPLSGLVSVSPLYLFLVACVASLGAPMSALLINAFAGNKVEGFAVAKATGFLIVLPVLAFFLPQDIDIIAGIIPGYWPAKAFAGLVDPSLAGLPLPAYLLIGTLYHIFLTIIFYKKYSARHSTC